MVGLNMVPRLKPVNVLAKLPIVEAPSFEVSFFHSDVSYDQIYHILIVKKQKTMVEDVSLYRRATADSDHYMVIAKVKQNIFVKNKNRNR